MITPVVVQSADYVIIKKKKKTGTSIRPISGFFYIPFGPMVIFYTFSQKRFFFFFFVISFDA